MLILPSSAKVTPSSLQLRYFGHTPQCLTVGLFGRKVELSLYEIDLAAMSIVDKLRGLQTSERLRSDHILTLELFQDTVNENGTLKEEVASLRKALKAAKEGSDEADEKAGGEDGNEDTAKQDAAIVQKVLKQDKELAELKMQVKSLTSKNTGMELSITQLKKSNFSNEKMKQELDVLLKADEERQKHEEQLEKELEEAYETIATLEKDVLALEAVTDVKKEIADLQEKQKEKGDSQLVEANAKNALLIKEIQKLMEREKDKDDEIDKLKETIEKMARKEKLVNQSNQEIEHALRSRIEELNEEASVSELNNQRVLEGKEGELIEANQIIKSLREELAAEKSNNRMQSNPLLLPADGEGERSMASSFFMTTNPATEKTTPSSLAKEGADFKAFIALKKENADLKKENADLKSRLALAMAASGNSMVSSKSSGDISVKKTSVKGSAASGFSSRR